MEEVYERILEDRIRSVPALHPGLQDLIRVLGKQAHCASRTLIICEPYVPVYSGSNFHRNCSPKRRSSLESLSGPSALWSPVQPSQYYYDCYFYRQYPDREHEYKDIEEKYNLIKSQGVDYSNPVCDDDQGVREDQEEEFEATGINQQNTTSEEYRSGAKNKTPGDSKLLPRGNQEHRAASFEGHSSKTAADINQQNTTSKEYRSGAKNKTPEDSKSFPRGNKENRAASSKVHSSKNVQPSFQPRNRFSSGPRPSKSDSKLDYRHKQLKKGGEKNLNRLAEEARNIDRKGEKEKISIVIDNKTGMVDIQAVSTTKKMDEPKFTAKRGKNIDPEDEDDCVLCDEMKQLKEYRELSTSNVNDELQVAGKLTSSLKKAFMQIAESFDQNIKLDAPRKRRIQPLANGEAVENLKEVIKDCPPVGDIVDNVCRGDEELVNHLMTLISEADCLNRLIEHLDDVQSKYNRKGDQLKHSSSAVAGTSSTQLTGNTSAASFRDGQESTSQSRTQDSALVEEEDDVPCDDVTQLRGFQITSYNDIGTSLNDAEQLTEQLRRTITELVRPLLPPETPPESFFQSIQEQLEESVNPQLENRGSSCPAYVDIVHSSNESMELVQRLAYLKNSSLFLNLLLQRVTKLMEESEFQRTGNLQEPPSSSRPQEWFIHSQGQMTPAQSDHSLQRNDPQHSTSSLRSDPRVHSSADLHSSSESSRDTPGNVLTSSSSALSTKSDSSSSRRKGGETTSTTATIPESSSSIIADHNSVKTSTSTMGPAQIMVNVNNAEIPLLELMEITNIITDVIIFETVNEMFKRHQYIPPSDQKPVLVETRSDGTRESPFRVADDKKRPLSPDSRNSEAEPSQKKSRQQLDKSKKPNNAPADQKQSVAKPHKPELAARAGPATDAQENVVKEPSVQQSAPFKGSQNDTSAQLLNQKERKVKPAPKRGSQARAVSEPGPLKGSTNDLAPKTGSFRGSQKELRQSSPSIKGSQRDLTLGGRGSARGSAGKVEPSKGRDKPSAASIVPEPIVEESSGVVKKQGVEGSKQAIKSGQPKKINSRRKEDSPTKRSPTTSITGEEPRKLAALIGKFEKEKSPKPVKGKTKAGVQEQQAKGGAATAAGRRVSNRSKKSSEDERQNAKLAALIGKFEKDQPKPKNQTATQMQTSQQPRSSVCAREDSQSCVDYEVDDTILYFARITPNAFAPVKESYHAAGFMLKSAYDYTIPPRGKAIVKTDLRLELPPRSYGRIAPCKCLAENFGVDVGSDVIDRDCRDNVTVLLFNHSDKPVSIKRGNKIAQLICETIHQSAARENCDLLN